MSRQQPPPPPNLPEQEHPYEPPPGYVPYGPRKRKPQRERSGLYLPLWSVILMLIVVVGLAGSVIGAVILLGGPKNVSGGDPQVIVITAAPTETRLPPSEFGPTTTPVTGSGEAQAQISVPLEGPTLAPTSTVTPTPLSIAVGGRVEVIGAGGVNIRIAPGTNQGRVTVGNPGDILTVIGGPEEVDGLTWWQVRKNDGQSGWAAENDRTQELLQAVP